MKKILLIEDDSSIIDVYQIVFKKAGFEIETITSGEKAIEKVKEIAQGKAKKPDLILLDLILTDINGIEVLKAIRSQEETEDLVVYILTNYTDKELKKMGYELKSEKFLLKANYTPTQLLEIIKKRLR